MLTTNQQADNLFIRIQTIQSLAFQKYGNRKNNTFMKYAKNEAISLIFFKHPI